jgi:hypothetical protein
MSAPLISTGKAMRHVAYVFCMTSAAHASTIDVTIDISF